jgi:hypothetical protein
MLNEMKKELINIKKQIDQMERWTESLSEMLYEIQETIFDVEDNISVYKEYTSTNRMQKLKDAASGMHQWIDGCPPRLLDSSRCSKNHIAAVGFYQSDFDLKKTM